MEKVKRIINLLGPGIITGAADDDPSGVATYAQTGAQFGYQQLWTTIWTIPFMTVIQEMCGRIGVVTGRGLGGIIRQHYPKWLLFTSVFILICANVINIGADLGAMAESAKMLVPIPFFVWLTLITAISLGLQIFIPYPRYARYLKFVVLSLLVYVLTIFFIKQDWIKVLYSSIVPTLKFNQDFILNLVALLGTTISPYLFFWQSDEEVEKRIEEGRQKEIGKPQGRTTKKDRQRLTIDTTVGMVFSNLIAFMIMLTMASTLGAHGVRNVNTATQAAQALKPLAGQFAFLLFAAGIIGGGMLAVPVLAGSAGYAFAEAFHLKAGLGKSFIRAPWFYGVIAASTLIGVVVNFTPIQPFKLLYYSAAINGVGAPLLMILVLLITNNKTIMKEHTNTRFSNVLGWIITVIMSVGAIALLLSLVKQ